MTEYSQLLQLRILRFDLLQNRNIRVRVLPQCEEVLIGRFGPGDQTLASRSTLTLWRTCNPPKSLHGNPRAIVCGLPSNTVLCRVLPGQRKLQFGISSSPLLHQPGESRANRYQGRCRSSAQPGPPAWNFRHEVLRRLLHGTVTPFGATCSFHFPGLIQSP